MYQEMDENGRPIPQIRRASLHASQTTAPLQISTVPLQTRRTVVRKRVLLIPAPQVLHKKRVLPTWLIFLLIGFTFVIVLNSTIALFTHQSLTTIVLTQQLTQAQLAQQSQPLTASERVTVHHQANRAEYNNDNPEWQVWSYSACSGCALAALMDAYGAQKNGKPLNCGDVLEVEYKLGVYDPGTTPTNSRGLLPPGQIGLDKTAAYFGFASNYSKNESLGDLIAMANSGTPSIISIPTHVMIITGGDSKYVKLADSGGLRLTTVTREQFLHGLPGTRLYAGEAWIPGWYFTLKPN